MLEGWACQGRPIATDLLVFSVATELAQPVSRQGLLVSRQGLGQLGLVCRDTDFGVTTTALQCETGVVVTKFPSFTQGWMHIGFGSVSRHDFCVATAALQWEIEDCRDRVGPFGVATQPVGVATQPVSVVTRPGLWVVSQQARTQCAMLRQAHAQGSVSRQARAQPTATESSTRVRLRA